MTSQKQYPVQDIIEEMRKVSWPTRKEATKLTIVVIASSIFVGLLVGFADIAFAQLLRLITQ